MSFIEEIAPLIQKYAPQYGISVCSPIIAQAILESASGKSELATQAHNYFGLKYTERCKTIGKYVKVGSEQNPDGTYVSSVMEWCKFADMESGVIGYFDFTNTKRYENLKGVTDPREYLVKIKEDGYATSLNYVNNLWDVIVKYDLEKYDYTEKRRVINVHAGHNPDGMVACGAVGLIKESTEARKVKEEVISLLRAQGDLVYDCTCNDGMSQADVLARIVEKCNSHYADLDVSIHFNAGVGQTETDGNTTGTEVLVYSEESKSNEVAGEIAESIAELGFKNRGVKVREELYVLRNTKAPAVLIECCFVDDPDDVALYEPHRMAEAIVKGINGAIINKEEKAPEIEPQPATEHFYIVQVGKYRNRDNAIRKCAEMQALGVDAIIKEIDEEV